MRVRESGIDKRRVRKGEGKTIDDEGVRMRKREGGGRRTEIRR
jgi:hypothetical protein